MNIGNVVVCSCLLNLFIKTNGFWVNLDEVVGNNLDSLKIHYSL